MKDLRNVDLNLLVVFNALAEEEHLTRAAEKLHLSQPAVSNALARLRDFFDDELFVRAPKGMKPTRKARALKQPIKQALEIIQNQLLDQDVFESKTAKNHFSIAVNSYAEFALLPRLIGNFRTEAPNVVLDIFPESDATTAEKLRSGELDIALDYLSLQGKDFIEEPFFEEELVVVAAKDHAELRNGLTIDLYNSLPQLSMHPRGHRGSHTEILLGRKHINRNIVMSVSNLISFAPLVANSDMICTLPKRLAKHFEKQLAISIYELPYNLDKIPIFMIYHRDRVNDPAHKWLRNKITFLATLKN
ncbi:LysR substrate-binding domain-containing protein [Agarilytica rhodophyticola]|uniref:LysR substrate-binding domain-containing protein n=1 Tax=Agarilytica rhodophyticola TaxID=1737490 RepID=UPI000B349491|nr:LysR substrate-binding domain-containing protein [Agarilytica rhodophyticola]